MLIYGAASRAARRVAGHQPDAVVIMPAPPRRRLVRKGLVKWLGMPLAIARRLFHRRRPDGSNTSPQSVAKRGEPQ